MMNNKQQELGLYYLRLGVGFYTLWLAWDMIIHQVQWRAFFAGFPIIGGMAEFWLVIGFVLYLLLGLSIITGWMNRASTLILAILIFLSLIPMGFLTPKVNAVLGPYRALTIKNLVWFGACLVLFTHPSDPYQPERRQTEGRPALVEKTKFLFRILLGSYFVWDGLLLLTNSSGYLSIMAKAVAQIPLLGLVSAGGLMTIVAVIQLAAGILIMSGIKYKWALWTMLLILVFHLIAVNWHASKGLLRAGGRFMMRDIVILSSCIYFLKTGPGMLILQIKVQRNTSTSTPPPPTPELPVEQPSENLF